MPQHEDGRTRRARQRRQATHVALLEAARVAFAGQGYAAVSPDHIAQVAGVSRATFYQHFESKADAFAALFDDVLGRLDAAVLGVELGPDEDPPELQLTGNLLRVLDILLEQPELTRLLLHEAVGNEDALDGRVEAFFDGVLDMIRRSLVLGEAAGLVRRLPVDLTATAILGSIKELLARRLPPDALDLGEEERMGIARAVVDFAVRGVGTPALQQVLRELAADQSLSVK